MGLSDVAHSFNACQLLQNIDGAKLAAVANLLAEKPEALSDHVEIYAGTKGFIENADGKFSFTMLTAAASLKFVLKERAFKV